MISHQLSSNLIKSNSKGLERRASSLICTAYSSRHSITPIPKHEFPENMISAQVAYQLVSDELQTDQKSIQNMATFVTSWMEPEANKLINETMDRNFADLNQYPMLQVLQLRCVSMLASLWNAPPPDKDSCAVGVSTIGSSEAFMLAALSTKFIWREKRKSAGLDYYHPNIIFGANAQVALEKFGCYFDVEVRTVPVSKKSNYGIDVDAAINMVDENTICVVGIMGSTFTGHFEPIKKISEALDKIQATKGWDIPIHVDGAGGGFVAPFLYPDLEWDFRIPRVHSINTSGHKYGLVYPGLGWVIWRDSKYLHNDLVFHMNYLGGNRATCTLNFSKGSSMVVAQYYSFIRLGREGYSAVIENCHKNAIFLGKVLRTSGYYEMLSDETRNMPVLAVSLNPAIRRGRFPNVTGVTTEFNHDLFDEYDISDMLQRRGWVLPAYSLPKNVEDIVALRIVIREMHSGDLVEKLFRDMIWAAEECFKIAVRYLNNPNNNYKRVSLNINHSFTNIENLNCKVQVKRNIDLKNSTC